MPAPPLPLKLTVGWLILHCKSLMKQNKILTTLFFLHWEEIKNSAVIDDGFTKKPIHKYSILFHGIINSSNLGIPQIRRRLVIIGVRYDIVQKMGVFEFELRNGFDYFLIKKDNAINRNRFNFLSSAHHLEVSGILKESKTNTRNQRLKDKRQRFQKLGTVGKHIIIIVAFDTPAATMEIS